MATGLEPSTLLQTWRPSPTDDPHRPGIEGYYLLKGIPNIPSKSLPPKQFVEGSHIDFLKCIEEIRRTFVDFPEIIKWWDEWGNKYLPKSDDSSAYLYQCKTRGKLDYNL